MVEIDYESCVLKFSSEHVQSISFPGKVAFPQRIITNMAMAFLERNF